jgi:hypothetical protein
MFETLDTQKRGGTVYVHLMDVTNAIDEVFSTQHRVTGMEGFTLEEGKTIPRNDFIVHFNNPSPKEKVVALFEKMKAEISDQDQGNFYFYIGVK